MTKRRLTVVVAALVTASSMFAAACSENNSTGLSPGQPRLSMAPDIGQAVHGLGIVPSPRGRRSFVGPRGQLGFDGSPTTSPTGPLTRHNGTILDHTYTYAIFVGPSWNTNQQFTADKITTIEAFFRGFGGSNYANIVSEYGPGNGSAFRGSFVDNRTPPNGADFNAVGAYVCAYIGFSPDPYGVYTVYTSDPPPPNSGYIGYHGQYSCFFGNARIAVVFNVDGLGYVTDPYQYHTDNAAALADITAHELEETITDPTPGNGWFAQTGYGEISDKCNFSFGPSPYVTLSNGVVFKLQGQWSNYAFQTGTGFSNANGEPGCINSAPPPLRVTVAGPQPAGSNKTCRWDASPSGGLPPYTIQWLLSEPSSGFYPNTGTGTSITSYNYQYVQQTYTATATVTDARGVTYVGSGYGNVNAPGYPYDTSRCY